LKTELDIIRTALHRRMCDDVTFHEVPFGYAISTGFMMPDGDPLTFFLKIDDDGVMLQDDGDTIPSALASGIDVNSGHRETLLRGILSDSGATFSSDDLSIHTDVFPPNELGNRAMRFISGLIRTQDLVLLNQENTRANFADDVYSAILDRLPDELEADERVVLPDGGPDLVIRSRAKGLVRARIFAAGTDLRLLEAIITFQKRQAEESTVLAVVDRRKNGITNLRFERAINMGLPIAAYDGRDDGWLDRVTGMLNSRPEAEYFH
jgi:hypothetical protein